MFFVGGLLIGIPMLLIWFFLRRQAQASLRWPTVPGRIVDSRLVQTRDTDGDLSTVASVTYAYTVGGTPLQGKRVKIGRGNARAIVQKYPAGTDVRVSYDPNQSSSAVLEPGGSGLKALLVVGVVVIVGAMGIGAMGIGGNQKASEGGQTNAQRYSAAMDLYNHGKFSEARSAFEDLAQRDSAEAKVYLGVMYAKGQGVPQDYVEAQKWFILAGDPGNKDREAMQKGLTPVQQQQAESKAKAWPPK
jgi:hypothetical protein